MYGGRGRRNVMGITWPVAAIPIAYFLVQVASLLDTEGHGGRYNPSHSVRLLPPRRRSTGLTRPIQRLDSPSATLLIGMVVASRHCHGLMAGEVVDLLDRDAKVQQPYLKMVERQLL